jgi:hypothetical protein
MSVLDFSQIDSLVADLKAKDQALADASVSYLAAQTAANDAVAAAASASATQNNAHDVLVSSVQTLSAALAALVNPPVPAAPPASAV